MRLGFAVHAMFMVFVLVACATKPVVPKSKVLSKLLRVGP